MRLGERGMRYSFKTKLIVSLSAVILLIFCLSGYISYRIHLSLFEQEISKQYTKANEQALARLDIHIQNLYRTSDYIVFHPYVEQIVKRSSAEEGQSDFEQYVNSQELSELLNKVKLDAPQLSSLYVYNLQGVRVYYDNNQSVNKLLPQTYASLARELEDTNGSTVWRSMELPSAIERSGHRRMIVASRLMKTAQLETYGVLIMVFDQQLFSRYLRELTADEAGQVYLFDQRDQLLYTDDRELDTADAARLLGARGTQVRREGQVPYLYANSEADTVGFTLVSRVSLENMQSRSEIIVNIALYSALVSIVIAWVLILLTSQQLLRPLKLLMQGMRRLREGRFDTRVEIRTQDELAFLGQGFNTMAANLDALIREVYERRLREREAELSALQAQLNPHFMYNTLDTIYWELYMKEDMKTARLIVALSEMLRYALEPVGRMTTLRDELHQIRNYFAIQQARFEDDLETSVEADDSVLDAQVIRFLLQPLIENSFVHAFRDHPFDMRIRIVATHSGEQLRLLIADNGRGMEEAEIRELLAQRERGRVREQSEQQDREHIGMRSVLRRLELVYGQAAGLDIASAPGAGTTIRLTLPLELRQE
ncbi:histidine kinase [Paenibacillus sp. IB182496]|uniref:Histidine kinase n=1 Tax=Paenibacillus sabuli TaxID=2772509 RepID=A0A927GQ53_9BACL|nr:sensor histidine kinase [Paenibacillus sabuli]MBD2844169.1 histidine kinase [Paenibacillus sabuli]